MKFIIKKFMVICEADGIKTEVRLKDANNPFLSYELSKISDSIQSVTDEYNSFLKEIAGKEIDDAILKKSIGYNDLVRDLSIKFINEIVKNINELNDFFKSLTSEEFKTLIEYINIASFGTIDQEDEPIKKKVSTRSTLKNSKGGATRKRK